MEKRIIQQIKTMKLKLEQIAPYFPYKVMARFPEINNKRCRKYVTGVIGALYSDASMCCFTTVNASPDTYKPLLRPIYLYMDINSDSFKELNCDLLNQIEISDFAIGALGIDGLSYGTVQICLKNHIDIFGLISAGLAKAI